jgi:predicted metal-dependent HD superfamily phosphohydrolase
MRERWSQLCSRIGRGDALGALWFALDALYRHPPRAYHNLAHVGACLALLDELRPPMETPDAVEFALFLHDSVYEPGSADNEKRSAQVAEAFMSWLRVPAAGIETVTRLIRVTDHRTATHGPDDNLVVDVDMAILGSPAHEYDAYAAAVRAEFAHVPLPQFNAGRAGFLQAVRDRPAIFRTERFRRRFEGPARANIDREFARLSCAGG